MAAEGSVEEGGVALVVSMIDPVFKLLMVGILGVLIATDPFGLELNFADVDFDEFEVAFEGKLV